MHVPRVAWLVLVAVFLAFEGFALTNDVPGDTFSDLVWTLLAAAPLLSVPLVAFLGWLAWHFVAPILRRRERGER